MIVRHALTAVFLGLLLAASLAPSLALALAPAAKPDIPGIAVPDLPEGAEQALKKEKRMALVIGNGKYPASPLRKPAQDARSMADALRYLGFEVELHIDLDGEAMTRAIDAFADRLKASGAVGLFYYSGHGVQTGSGGGYLVPVDLSPEADEIAIERRAMPLGYALARMESARVGIDILLIDACRNNPWVRSFKGPNSADGTLRPMAAGTRSLVGFATRNGRAATEGSAATAHSPFTQHLLTAMFQPGLPLRGILDRVQEEVRAETNNLQIPDYSSSLGTMDVYFIPSPPRPATLSPDQAAWNTIKDSRRPEDFKAFATIFPNSTLAPTALEQAGALDVTVPERLAPEGMFRDCPDCPEMVVIPAGSFQMGCVEGRDCQENEFPVREVTLRSFALGKTEVTFDEWDACVADGGCPHRPNDEGWGRGTRPVINVSWDDVQTYIKWLNRKSSQTYRLPTEAEWEYAARAGTETAYSWGNDIGTGNANCNGCGSQWDGKQTAPVGSFRASAFGLHDMHGNVWESVQDCWHNDYLNAPIDGSARKENSACNYRVGRGGSWFLNPRNLRSANRFGNSSDYRIDLLGFRLARTLP